MKLHIDNHVYDLQDSVGGARLGDLVTLKKERNLSVKSITERFNAVGASKKPQTDLDLLDNLEYLEAVVAVVWLARRKAGEDITIDEASEVPFTSVAFSWTDEEEADADPKGVPQDGAASESET